MKIEFLSGGLHVAMHSPSQKANTWEALHKEQTNRMLSLPCEVKKKSTQRKVSCRRQIQQFLSTASVSYFLTTS